MRPTDAELHAFVPRTDRNDVANRSVSTVVASCALVLVLAAACSGDEGEDAAAASLSGQFDEIDGVQVSSDQTPITPEDRRLIALAEERLTGECMASEGFDFSEVIEFGTRHHVPEPPLYLSPAELRRSGYQHDWAAAAESFLALNGPDGVPTFVEGMPQDEADAWYDAYLGAPDAEQLSVALPDGSVRDTPRVGCAADARRELYGSLENFARFEEANQQFSHDGLSRELNSHDAYREPVREWRSCMGRAGFEIDQSDYGIAWIQQQGAVALSAGGIDQTVLTAEVIEAVANADADCQESSGLYEARSELLPEAEEAIADRLGVEMSELTAFHHAVLERAKQVA